MLSDLFIHGIGGAKYDELTDQIICRFFGFEPPGFVALSATQRLDKNWSANMGIGVSTDEGKVGARAGLRYGW